MPSESQDPGQVSATPSGSVDETLKIIRSKPIENFNHEAGMNRLHQIWKSFLNGDDKLEKRIITDAICTGGIIGFVFGGIANTQEFVHDQIRKFNTNVYTGKHAANRALSDHIYIRFFQQATKSAIRCGFFSSLFVTPITLAATYHDELRFIDGALAGAVTGGTWKAMLGPRAILTNSVLGAVFGLTFISLMKSAFYLTGTNYRELRMYDMIVLDNYLEEKRIEEDRRAPKLNID